MKDITIALFSSREDAEKAIQQLHTDAGVDAGEISYLYKTIEGEEKEINPDEVVGKTPGEGARDGAVVGGSIGAIASIATIAGVIPIIGPIFAAGPLITALGFGAGALGTTAAGALTGAAAGGLIGALVSWGASEEVARSYEERVLAGDILVAVHSENSQEVREIMENNNAFDLHQYTITI